MSLIACKNEIEDQTVVIVDHIATPQLLLDQANNLAELPLHCIETEYPNKMGACYRSTRRSKKTNRPASGILWLF
ncbi:hypothetical protein JCM19298_2117 [Nonlabens ulvanivorans]|nr:hypothetical protein JCM19298_2117 [Nonlabens ulvanivorans]